MLASANSNNLLISSLLREGFGDIFSLRMSPRVRWHRVAGSMLSASLSYYVTSATAWSSSDIFTTNMNKKITGWFGLLSQKQGTATFYRRKTQLPDMCSSCMHDEESVTSSRQWVVILFLYWVCTFAFPYNTLYTIHYTLYTIRYTQYIYRITNTLCTAHNTLHTAHNTLYTIH